MSEITSAGAKEWPRHTIGPTCADVGVMSLGWVAVGILPDVGMADNENVLPWVSMTMTMSLQVTRLTGRKWEMKRTYM